MDFDPGLDEFEFGFLETAFEEFAFGDGKDGFVVLVFDVDVWALMLLVVEVVHHDDDAVEHRDGWHFGFLGQGSLILPFGLRLQVFFPRAIGICGASGKHPMSA